MIGCSGRVEAGWSSCVVISVSPVRVVRLLFANALADSPPEEEGYKHMIGRPQRGSVTFCDSRGHLAKRSSDGGESENSEWRPIAPVGPFGTYTDWSWSTGGHHLPSFGQEQDERIDFVFVDEASLQPYGHGHGGGWQVNRHVVIDNLVAGLDKSPGWKSRWSDHRAVMVELKRKR